MIGVDHLHGHVAANFLAGGFDGIEIHSGHGYLIQQFFSPLTNQRTDGYGGSAGNRLRFAIEVIRSVRAAAGPDVPIGLRVSADERLPGGLGVADMTRVCAALAATGELDYLSVSNGTHESYAGLVPGAAKGMGEMAGYAAENISSIAIEVENVLVAHPAVLEAAVVATAHDHWGEVPVAFVAVHPDAQVDAAELISWVRERLAHFKAPREVHFGELPKTSTGKIRKNELRDRVRSTAKEQACP